MPKPATVSALVAAALLWGCRGYQPGSFTGPRGSFAGEQRTVGCLDVAFSPAPEAGAEGAAVAFTFANRCDAPVIVDLRAVRATRLYPGGSAPLRLFDPRREVYQGRLPARHIGYEVLEYLPEGTDERIDDVCLDLSGIDAGAQVDSPVTGCLHGGRAPGAMARRARK